MDKKLIEQLIEQIIKEDNELIKKDIPDRYLYMPIQELVEELDLSIRTYNCLKRTGVESLIEFTDKTPEDIMKIKNMSKESFSALMRTLKYFGISLKESENTSVNKDDSNDDDWDDESDD